MRCKGTKIFWSKPRQKALPAI